MTGQARSLEQLQRWMQVVITHHGGVTAGVTSAEARSALDIDRCQLEAVIPASSTQSSFERLGVYANAYYARLLQCLRELFPVCRQAVGDDIFDDFAFGYLQQFPPRSYTLGKLAADFVSYLESTRHDHFADDESALSWSLFVVELAQLEHVIDEVFDGPGIENEPPLRLADLAAIPMELWPTVRIVPAVCLRLLTFSFPVNDFYGAVRRGESPEVPSPNCSYLAISRRDYVVRRYPLNPAQYTLLHAIVVGDTLGDAVAAAVEQCDDPSELENSLAKWFATWSHDRLFSQINTHP